MSMLRKLADNTWVSTAPESQVIKIPERVNHIGRIVLWPLAIILFIHSVFILAMNGSVTDDLTTVFNALQRFLNGVNVYNENYTYVDPHYLYSPGATLVLSPLALLGGFLRVRVAFVILNALAICIALALATRFIGYKLNSLVLPGSIVLAFLTESVRNTLVFSNINGVLLLALMLFLTCIINHKPIWAGIFIGFAILIKPIFLPLLFIPFVYTMWACVIIAIALPVLINLIAWPIVPGASDYITRTMPYLSEVRDFSNSSLSGQITYFGISHSAYLVVAALMALIICAGLIFLLRYRHNDPIFWVSTTSSLLLSGVFFLSSLGQMYYSMLLFPAILTVLRSRSVMHTWLMWVAIYCIFSPQSWVLTNIQGRIRPAGEVFGVMPNPIWGEWLLPLLPCIGWAIFAIIISTTAFWWWYEERGIEHLRHHRTLREEKTAPNDIKA